MISFGSSIGSQSCVCLGDRFYKIPSSGYEYLSEVIAEEFISCIEGIDYVKYYLDTITVKGKETLCCYSNSMLNSGESLVSVYDLLDIGDYWYQFSYLSSIDRFYSVIDEVSSKTNLDIDVVKVYLSSLIKIDYLILNEDRHFGNISLIQKSGQYRFSPIYDNGLSLLSDIIKYPLSKKRKDFLEYINSASCRPFCRSFNEQLSLVKDSNPLKINTNRFNVRMQAVREDDYKPVFGKVDEFERCLKVIDKRLSEREGIIWVPLES